MTGPRRINRAGLDLIRRFESLVLDAYLCPAKVWSIGYGHTGDVKPGDHVTAHQAEAILSLDLDRFERGVDHLTASLGLNGNQFSALVSFAFNVGLDALKTSTLLRYLRAGNVTAGSEEFGKWTHANGKVLAGLVKRREAERQLFVAPAPGGPEAIA